MYKDMKRMYWWKDMNDEEDFVLEYFICQEVKFEHQRPEAKVQPLDIPMLK